MPDLAEAPISTLSYAVEVWDDEDIAPVAILAATVNSSIARAAFDAAVKARPHQIVRLRQKALEIAVNFPEGLPKKLAERSNG